MLETFTLNSKNWTKRPFRLWVLAATLRILGWIGIKTELLILEREACTPPRLDPTQYDFEFRFLSPDDLDELVRLEPDVDRDFLQTMFQNGKLCFGVWDEGRLVAKMWCDLDEIYHPIQPRALTDDEVYLLLAYVDPTVRGQGLAPLMRTAGYAALRDMGRTRIYSYSRFFNIAARRFKNKLGTKEQSLTIHFLFFGRWSKCITLDRRTDS